MDNPNRKRVHVGTSLDPELVRMVDAWTRKYGTHRAATMEKILKKWAEDNKAEITVAMKDKYGRSPRDYTTEPKKYKQPREYQEVDSGDQGIQEPAQGLLVCHECANKACREVGAVSRGAEAQVSGVPVRAAARS